MQQLPADVIRMFATTLLEKTLPIFFSSNRKVKTTLTQPLADTLWWQYARHYLTTRPERIETMRLDRISPLVILCRTTSHHNKRKKLMREIALKYGLERYVKRTMRSYMTDFAVKCFDRGHIDVLYALKRKYRDNALSDNDFREICEHMKLRVMPAYREYPPYIDGAFENGTHRELNRSERLLFRLTNIPYLRHPTRPYEQ